MGLLKKNEKALLIVLVLLITVPVFFKIIIDLLFEHKIRNNQFFYNQCNKVWAHRGYFKDFEQNSIEAFNKAIELGAKGVEVDIFFDLDLAEYIVSHDYPYNLKNGELLTLSKLFHNLDQSIYYWLDFKNLKQLKKDEVILARNKLKQLMEQYRLQDKIIIESKKPSNLQPFSREGFQTSYWVSFNELQGQRRFWINIYALKIKYIMNYFSAVSMNFRNYSHALENSLGGLPVLLFTINDKKVLNSKIKNQNVKIILSDKSYYTQPECEK
ncbi:glycerophosphodiester phosphodiesterase [Thalassotalea montiporae]